MEFVLVVLIIVLFVMLGNLKGRVKTLERAVWSKSAQKATQPQQMPQSTQGATLPSTYQEQAVATTDDIPTETQQMPEEDYGPGAVEKFGQWIKEDWLLKLGALLLLIGFGWLVTYAFLNNWIGPMGRIALGIIAGVGILVLGSWRIQSQAHQGKIFLLLGSTVILLTVFAAREIYGYFTPLTALVTMFLSTAYVAFVGVKYNSRLLVLGSMILAAIAPTLTASPTSNHISLFSYLTVIILGSIWVVAITGWRSLTLAAIIIAGIYSVPVLTGHSPDQSKILMFAYGFASLFYVFNTIGLLKLKGKEIASDLTTAAVNGMFLLVWISAVAPKEWQSLIITAWMLVFAAGAFSIFRITSQKVAFYIYAGISIAMLAAATAVELDGSSLAIAYIVESFVISMIAYGALKDVKVSEKLSLLMIGPFMYTLGSLEKYARSITVFNKHFAVLALFAVCLFLLGFIYRTLNRENQIKDFWSRLYISQIILGSVYIYGILWYALHIAIDNNSIAVMIALVIYTIIGLITYFYGLFHGKKVVQFYGGILLGLVVLRLILADVWRMDMGRRIATFFMVGALLISTAFIGKKKHNIQ